MYVYILGWNGSNTSNITSYLGPGRPAQRVITRRISPPDINRRPWASATRTSLLHRGDSMVWWFFFKCVLMCSNSLEFSIYFHDVFNNWCNVWIYNYVPICSNMFQYITVSINFINNLTFINVLFSNRIIPYQSVAWNRITPWDLSCRTLTWTWNMPRLSLIMFYHALLQSWHFLFTDYNLLNILISYNLFYIINILYHNLLYIINIISWLIYYIIYI